MLLNPVTFHAPESLEEALKLYSSLENVKLKAGGTFLLNSLKLLKRKGAKTPENLISLSKVPELKGVSVEGDNLIIKAMTTITDLSESPDLKDNFAVLKEVCKNISTNPIRNMATVGGNLTCRYTWTEMPAAMIGLDATMHFTDANGKTSSLAAEEFYKAAAKTEKIFTHVSIPRKKDVRIAYRRIKKTQYVDIPLLSLMISVRVDAGKIQDARVAVNNCVQFAQRDSRLEEFLNGSRISESLAEEALDHIDEKIYDTRSSDYKKHMFRVCLKSSLREIIEQKN